MGLLKHLLFWPVTGPMFLTEFSLGKVQGVVREELTDDSRVKEALLDLQLRMELDEIDEEEYAAEEARLMRELREVRRWREEFGMATRGGVVQMGDAEGPPGAPDAGPDRGPAPTGTETTREGPDDASAATEPDESPAVPRGATLEITLDWDEEDDDGADEEGEWDPGSPGASGPASS